jgi:hypothetical protein
MMIPARVLAGVRAGTMDRAFRRWERPRVRAGGSQRTATIPDDAEHAEIERRLARLDRTSRHGPWTHAVLAAIGERPGVPAIELATSFGREKLPFKLDVRKLKELGLTESLRPGYRLSPRGESVLARLDAPR